jgi:poly-gamma-glutamate synthesis protein (capsule biosynthesis protein)
MQSLRRKSRRSGEEYCYNYRQRVYSEVGKEMSRFSMVANKKENVISFIAGGDLIIDGKIEYHNGKVTCARREQPESVFASVSSLFKGADVRFCNLEAPLCSLVKKGTIFPGLQNALSSEIKNVAALKYAGIDIVALPNNHMMSYGWDGVDETINVLEKSGIAYVGAGKNLKEATQPKVLEIKNVKIGFLAFYINPIAPGLPPTKSRALENRPGLSEIALSPLYPPPQLNRQHVELFEQSIKEAKALSDVLMVCCHWGVQGQTIAIHQTALGHLAIDSGADLVIGTHPHNPQAVEVYQNKVIIYSLGSLAFDAPMSVEKEGLLLQAVISDKMVQKVSLRPLSFNAKGVPELLKADEQKGAKIFKTLEYLSKEFDTRLTYQNAEIVVQK